MTKNSGKGGKKHKSLKNTPMREIVYRENDQEYAIVTNMLGHGRCHAVSFSDKISRLCIIRGNMRKKSAFFIRKGDVILISLRDYQEDKADIIHLYTIDEVNTLKMYGEITDSDKNLLETDENMDYIEFCNHSDNETDLKKL